MLFTLIIVFLIIIISYINEVHEGFNHWLLTLVSVFLSNAYNSSL